MQMGEDDEKSSSSSSSNINNNDNVGSRRRRRRRRGCIRSSKGPWLVRRMTKNKGIVTKYRHPSERERLNNKRRERRRRSITHNIFAGLKAHGNYQLPKNADSNDLLKALCQEAGWHVDHDGTIFRSKNMMVTTTTMHQHQHDDEAMNISSTNTGKMMITSFGVVMEDEGYCNCKEKEKEVENVEQLGVNFFYHYQYQYQYQYQQLLNSKPPPDTTLTL